MNDRRAQPQKLQGPSDRELQPWRNRVEAELHSLDNFQRALTSADRKALNRLINGVRNRRTAGGLLPAHDSWMPLVLSMLLECYSKISELESRIEKLIAEE